MSTICFYSQFTKTLVGVNGLTVTWDIEQITRADGSRSALVTGGATNITIGRRGLYGYYLTNANLHLYDYIATAITAGDVDQQEIAALWTDFADVDSIADHVWDEGISGHLTSGSAGYLLDGAYDNAIAGAVDPLSNQVPGTYPAGSAGYTLGNLKCSDLAVDAQSVIAGAPIRRYRETTWTISITGLGSLANRSKLWFSIKRDYDDPDSEAICQVEESAGLLYINGEPATAANGSLVVNDVVGGNITITVNADVQGGIVLSDDYTYDVKIKRTVGIPISALCRGDFEVAGSSTRTV